MRASRPSTPAALFPTIRVHAPDYPVADPRAPAPDLYEAIVQALPFGISVYTEQGQRVFANATARDIDGSANPHDARRPPPADDRQSRVVETVVPGPRGDTVVETRLQPVQAAGTSYWVRTAVDVTDQRKVERELFNRAYLDELTGLPNRSLAQQSTESLIDTIGPRDRFALAFIDLDNFKHINDYYSHAVGDALLVKIGARLSSALRPQDLVARIGGDEFVLLLTQVNDLDSLRLEVDALGERLKQPFFIDGHEIFASASIGVSLYPEHGRTYDLLRRNADSAMYRVKSGVKGGAVLFDNTMGHAATARMALEQRLRLAIRDRRFCCAFQPKVDLRTHAVVGVEVLLRWRDEHGIIQAPGDFVGLAVELGLINEITHLVLAETMRVINHLDVAFGAHTSISLNIAAKQAEDLGFMLPFVEALADTGCPERFMVELTEEAFFAKSRFQAEVLPRLRGIGSRVSIDDFGVGYSSLAALADITADEIKIDRSFITDIHRRPRSQSVLRAIESLSHALGMSIIAEGVETFEELAYLQAATRIHHAQGYYFARPLLLDQFNRGTRYFSDRSMEAVGRDPATVREPPVRTLSGRRL